VPSPLVPSTRRTAPCEPNRYFGRILGPLVSTPAGQTRPFGHCVPPVLHSVVALVTQAKVHPGLKPAPQHSGLVLQTCVVQGEQSHGRGSSSFTVYWSCVQWVGEKT